jgi:serine phosphatase RsbU (regulator of sigma subunit)
VSVPSTSSAPRTRLFSLRTRLVLLVLLGVLPALVLTLYTAAEQRKRAAADIQQDALRVARLASAGQERLIEGARQLLVMMARLPEVRGDQPEAANKLLADIQQQYPIYLNFGVIEMDGRPFASALPLPPGLNLADRGYFQRAIQTKGFAMGEYQIGRISGKASVNFGYPVTDEAGHIQRVVFAALDLSWLEKLAAEAELPPGGNLAVVDGQGSILVYWPDPETMRGKTVTDHPVWKTIMEQRQGTAQAPDRFGISRLFAFTQLRGAQGAGFVTVGIGVPTEVAYAEADRVLKRNLTLLGIAGALAVAAAWFGSDWVILRRVRALVGATERLEAGDLGARTGIRYGHGELGRLAHSFDSMAGSIEQRIAERDRAEASLKELNQELERRVAERTAELRRKNEELEADLALAREFQLAWLPTEMPEFPANNGHARSLGFHHAYQASGAVGGDFFSILPISETRIGVAVCDAMGHGVRAALITAMMRGLFEEFRDLADDPGAFFTRINRELTGLLSGTETTLFVTACYLVVDVTDGRVCYANAGHPWPLHLRRSDGQVGSLRQEGTRAGPALGLVDGVTYRSFECQLDAGDSLLLFTDGLFEISGPGDEQFGMQRLTDILASQLALPTENLLQEVISQARRFSPANEFDDDLCVVGIDLRAPGHG